LLPSLFLNGGQQSRNSAGTAGIWMRRMWNKERRRRKWRRRRKMRR
jgi:hypothetical protein